MKGRRKRRPLPSLAPGRVGGTSDEAAKRFGFRFGHGFSRENRIERVRQIVLGHVLPRLSKRRIEVVDASAIPDRTVRIDNDSLRRNRGFRAIRQREREAASN